MEYRQDETIKNLIESSHDIKTELFKALFSIIDDFIYKHKFYISFGNGTVLFMRTIGEDKIKYFNFDNYIPIARLESFLVSILNESSIKNLEQCSAIYNILNYFFGSGEYHHPKLRKEIKNDIKR